MNVGFVRRVLLAALALLALAIALTVSTALEQPFAGWRDTVPAEATDVQVTAGRTTLEVQPTDLIEEPDFFDTYEEMAAFFERQTRLRALLAEPVIDVEWQLPEDDTVYQARLTPQPGRELLTLPPVFWFQIFAGSASLLIGAWVFALRPASWGARMLALCGLMFPVFSFPAAIYSTRDLAMDGELFRVLSSLNHTGAFMFGCALVAIFLCHPRPLVQPRWLLLPAVFGAWLLADVLRLAPDQNWGSRLPVMLEMLLAVGVAVVQWRRHRGQPAERAALRWFALSALVGSGLFVLLTVGAGLLGLFPPMAQGYAFGFFLIMFFGLALGVGRYRLFDLDVWAWRVLLWVLGVVAVMALDTLLVLALRWDPTVSLGTTLLVCGALYFPLRQWLWQRVVERGALSVEQMLPELVRIAFSASRGERQRLWAEALDRLYAPLANEAALPAQADDADSPRTARVMDDGLALAVPACAGLPPRVLRFRNAGRRLFSGLDARFVTSLCELMSQAAAGRDSFERGVADERQRVARDMHDEIGARLLTVLHTSDTQRANHLLREAIAQLRAIVRGMTGQAQPMDEFVADLRHQTRERAEAAQLALTWHSPDEVPALGARAQYQLRAALGELVSNAIRHAQAQRLWVEWTVKGPLLVVSVSDDGCGFEPAPLQPADASISPAAAGTPGLGLGSVRDRMAQIGGEATWGHTDTALAPQGTRATLRLPHGG